MSEDTLKYDANVQRFNRTSISMHDFEQAAKFMEASARHDNDSPEFEALFITAIILYARPFSPNEKKASPMAAARLDLDPAAVLGEQFELHRQVIDRRNKAIAHAEWNFYPTSQIRAVSTNPRFTTGFVTTSKRWHPVNEGINPSDLRAMAEKMQKACLDALLLMSMTSKIVSDDNRDPAAQS